MIHFFHTSPAVTSPLSVGVEIKQARIIDLLMHLCEILGLEQHAIDEIFIDDVDLVNSRGSVSFGSFLSRAPEVRSLTPAESEVVSDFSRFASRYYRSTEWTDCFGGGRPTSFVYCNLNTGESIVWVVHP